MDGTPMRRDRACSIRRRIRNSARPGFESMRSSRAATHSAVSSGSMSGSWSLNASNARTWFYCLLSPYRLGPRWKIAARLPIVRSVEVLKMHRFEVATCSRSFALLAALTAASLTAVSQPALAGAGGPAWMKLRPAASPPARAAQAMAYDRAARDVVVFGGYDAIGYRNDTWTWDGAT